MLFDKKIEPRCVYCKRGASLNEEQIMCLKKGIVGSNSACRHFQYDPLKRIPPKPISADFSHLKEEDFVL
ncbi:MAG: hypothetical protein PUB51_08470 [Oscillospiraceae bacterium]|nr:hypothetical protein [Oscillospiraceae bacterium]